MRYGNKPAINNKPLAQRDSSLCHYLHTCAHKHVDRGCKHTNMSTATCRLPLWILQRQQGKYLCFESITSHIFIFLSPCCYNFLPCQTNQNTTTKRRPRERLRFSTVRFADAQHSQTGSVRGDMTCVFVWAAETPCADFQVRETSMTNSV